jgi:hypothetical protein
MAEYKERFESDHFTQNEPATQARLKACLDRDDSNTRRYPSGEHIRVIQDALRKVRAILPSVPTSRRGRTVPSGSRRAPPRKPTRRPGPLSALASRSTTSSAA